MLITGAKGFIGTHLVRELNPLFDLTLFDGRYLKNQDGNKCESMNFCESNTPEMRAYFEEVDVVVHLAASSDIADALSDPFGCFKNNTSYTAKILEASRIGGIKLFLLISTGNLYGTKDIEPRSELDQISLENPYLSSKYCAENWASIYSSSFGMNVVIARLFNVYGPGQLKKTIIPKIIYEKLSKQKIVNGDLNIWRDYIYIDDVIDFIKACIESNVKSSIKNNCRVLNVGSGNACSINDIKRYVSAKTSIDFNKPQFTMKSEVNYLQSKIGLAADLYSWAPKIRLEDGLELSIDWYSNNYRKLELIFHG